MAQPNPPSLEDLLDLCHIKYKTPNPEFMRLLKDLFSREKSGQVSDRAFAELQRRATEFFDELITVFQPIRDEMAVRDHASHNWYYHALLDCIACAPKSKRLSILYHELHHPHPEARQIAIWNLGRVGQTEKEARKMLHNALSDQLSTHEETKAFHDAIWKALRNENK